MNVYKDRIKKFVEIFGLEILYTVINTIFLLFLHQLNKELFSKYSNQEYLEMLMYQNYKPVVFFIITVLSIIWGIIIVKSRFKKFKYKDFEPIEILYAMLSFAFTAVIICLLIIAINNPILQAIAFVIGSAVALAYAYE
ncbi:hypothetical protein [Traorella massiliensis]|uniref:hypothetical protein n=1 Tax=Traorella massiliensis TaxID=1903263 RepID=UPI0008F955F0|nr:hypothetical protein [Traorella massiliensis]